MTAIDITIVRSYFSAISAYRHIVVNVCFVLDVANHIPLLLDIFYLRCATSSTLTRGLTDSFY